MEIEKAIKILDGLKRQFMLVKNVYYTLDLSTSVLEKQVAKKITVQKLSDTLTTHHCSSCKTCITSNFYNYCPECGQKLDWSVDNE